jgi:ribosome assembly protein YihI (activator of Der GTPase)
MKRLPEKKEDLQSREERKIKTKDETRTRKHAGRSQIIVRCNSQMKKKKKKQIEDPEVGLRFQLPAEGDERCAAAHRRVCDPCRFVVI